MTTTDPTRTDAAAAPRRYDAIVIGSGQAGGPLAGDLARAGRRVALIEREHVGGTCINEGCTPTKTMIASGRVAFQVGRSERYGIRAGDPRVDMETVRRRKREMVERFRRGSERRIEEQEGLELLWGEARFEPGGVVAVTNGSGTVRLEADRVFINTGQRPAVPDLDGLDGVPYLDSTSVMELGEVPEHLLVLGGGYIGVEFGQLFRRLGADVTLVQRASQLLAREDEDVADALAEILREDGCTVLTGAEAVRVVPVEGGVELTVRREGAVRRLRGSHLLVATGRRSNTDTLGLDAVGVDTDERGNIVVDERLRTSNETIYALGDVKGGPAFTHISYDDYRVVKSLLLGAGERSTADRPVPYVVFTDPQLGRVGLSERQARERGHAVGVGRLAMDQVARALEVGETRGSMKVVVDTATERILGAAVLGLEGGELMGALQIAMMGDLPYPRLRDGVFAHPTLLESLNTLFGAIES